MSLDSDRSGLGLAATGGLSRALGATGTCQYSNATGTVAASMELELRVRDGSRHPRPARVPTRDCEAKDPSAVAEIAHSDGDSESEKKRGAS